MLAGGLRPVYASGACEIDLARRELRVVGSPVPVGGRAFEIVEILAESAGELVTKNELMDRVWPGAIVNDNTLQMHISAVRKALGSHRTILKTESGRGYRLLGDWTARDQGPARVVVAQQLRVFETTPATNIPALATGVIGRSTAVQRLRDLVSAYRVVTLTGPGGIGKTALALEVASGLQHEFADGTWLVELASLADPGLVPSAVASALGLKLGGEEISAEAVARAVGGNNLLLVLDNCEHVVDAAVNVVEALIGFCPRTTILATSREVLRTNGEYVYRVPPLDVPALDAGEPDRILGHSAVELFIARAGALDSDFSPHAENLRTVAAICRHLDGIPLAIEFAAARAALLGIEEVAVGLRDRFTLLISGRRTALPRHRTLRATLDWSYDLLPEVEQRLLRHLAVFPAGFTLDTAVAVATDTGLDAAVVPDRIVNLVAKSLVALDRSETASRWYLLESIRAYALEKLNDCGEFDDVARRGAAHFRSLFAPPSGAKSRLSSDELTLRAREIDNIRAALDWSFSPSGSSEIGIDLTAAYAPIWLHLSLIGECRERCEHALLNLQSEEKSPSIWQRMRLKTAFASASYTIAGPSEEVRTILEEALELASILQDADTQILILAQLSAVHVYQGEYAKGRATVEQLREIAYRVGEPGVIGVADRRMGNTLIGLGRLREAQECFENALEALATAEAQRTAFWYHSDYRHLARAMLARALWLQGFVERARAEAGASIAELSDNQLVICRALSFGMCRVSTMTGDFATAEAAIERLTEVAKSVSAPFWQNAGLFLRGKLLVERGNFSEALTVLREAFDTGLRTGWRFSGPEFKGALAEALVGNDQASEALEAVEDALADARRQDGQAWYLPELLRIQGEVLLQQGLGTAPAEDCFAKASEIAREQGALFWELRVALSRARLRVSQHRRDEALEILRPVYDKFTEGFDTADLLAAKQLLDGTAAARPA